MKKQQTIITLPHAGNKIPRELEQVISQEFDIQKYDLYSSDIYSQLYVFGSVIIGDIHRELIDYNRERNNTDPIKGSLPEYGFHGTKNLLKKHTTSEREHLLSTYWNSYHSELEKEVNKQIDLFGKVLIIAGHTMEGVGPKNAPDAGKNRADIVIGTLDGTLAQKEYLDSIIDYLYKNSNNITIEVDKPYKGKGYITTHYGRPKEGYNIIQIEVNITSYEDPQKKEKIDELIFNSVKEVTTKFQKSIKDD